MKEISKGNWRLGIGIIFLVILFSLLGIKIWREGIYTNDLGINVVVVGTDKVGILILRPENDVVSWVSLPNNLQIKVFNSEAVYPVVSLWSYGEQVKNSYTVMEKSLGQDMGVALARTIKIYGSAGAGEVLSNLYRPDLKTDLSWRDRFLVDKFLTSAVTSKKLLELEIPTKAYDQIVDPDGKTMLEFNSVTQLWTKNKLILDSILAENVEVTVNNLSGKTGLGTQVAKQMESSGMRVVAVKSDTTENVNGTGCTYKIAGEAPFTERFLQEQLQCKRSIKVSGQNGTKEITVWLK